MLMNLSLDTIYFCIAALIVFITIVIIILLWFSFRKKQTKFDYKIKDQSNSIRIYVIDLERETVQYFNRVELRKKHKVSLTEFYDHFQFDEREDVINWINDLLDKESHCPSFKEAHVISKHRKANFFSLLQVTKINYKSRVIYLDSYLLKTTASKKNRKDNIYRFSTQESFNRLLYGATASKGITFSFNFYDKRNKDEEISRLIFLKIIAIFNSYILPSRPTIEYNNHHVIMCDLHAYSRPQIMNLISIIKTDINKFLLISALQDKISYCLGVVENKYFPKEPEKIVNTVTSLAMAAQEDEEQIIWYEEGKKLEGNESETYRTEVERIIRDKKLKYLFRPIIDMGKSHILGYLSFIEPQDSFFGTIEELKNYAMRTEDDKVLFTTITRNVITRFVQEKDGDSLRLFFNINNLEKNYVNRTLSHIQNIKNVHIVLCMNEKELCERPDNSEDSFLSEIKVFKSKGYEIALEIDDNDLTLSPLLYNVFDFFVIDVDTNLKLGSKYSQRSLYNFRGLIEKLLKYHRPIIANNVPGWDSVELIEKLGIDLVSSEVISPKDENVMPIPSKSLIKIKNIKK